MKNPVDITLTTIHAGRCRKVVTLGLNGKDQAQEFLEDLNWRNGKAFTKLATRMRVVAEHDRYENEMSFKSLAGALFEFKIHTPAIRLYAFYDDLDGDRLSLPPVAAEKAHRRRTSRRHVDCSRHI